MLRRATVILLVAYILVTLYAVARGLLRLPLQGAITPIATLLAFSFAVLHAGQRLGWKNGFLLLALTFGVALTFESVGVATGMVYGPYHYSDLLGPKFLGLVPYLIPLAWFMMMYPSFILAGSMVPSGGSPWIRGLIWTAVGGLVMTAWDTMMDPMMVKLGYWIWDVPGAYFGVPLQNYWGWWLTTFITFGLYLLLSRPWTGDLQPALDDPFGQLAGISYATTGLGNGITAILIGLTGPAIIGLFLMNVPWLELARRKRSSALPLASP